MARYKATLEWITNEGVEERTLFGISGRQKTILLATWRRDKGWFEHKQPGGSLMCLKPFTATALRIEREDSDGN